MKIRKAVRRFFGFSQRETNAFLILIPLMIIIIFSEPLYELFRSPDPPLYASHQERIDSLTKSWNAPLRRHAIPQPSLHPFNPNLLSVTQWENFGLSKVLSQRIVKYINRGGFFKRKQDLLKIYGLDSSTYQRLMPFITLPPVKNRTRKNTSSQNKYVKAKKRYHRPELRYDLNECDSTMLTKIRGIGPVLSRRILLYRKKLGGFININQLYEIYHLDSMVIERNHKALYISDDYVPKKININTASISTLAHHPYIGYRRARWIVTYRFQHGPFQSKNEILELDQITKKDFDKIKSYITVQ